MCGIRSNTDPETNQIPSKPGVAGNCRAATGWQTDLDAQDESRCMKQARFLAGLRRAIGQYSYQVSAHGVFRLCKKRRSLVFLLVSLHTLPPGVDPSGLLSTTLWFCVESYWYINTRG